MLPRWAPQSVSLEQAVGFINERATDGPRQISTCLLLEPRRKYTWLDPGLLERMVSVMQGVFLNPR